MEEEKHVLEINLMSAQGLKVPTGKLLRLQTYAAVWVDPSNKLRTRVDRIDAENPVWNDKFVFQVSSDFLSSETSGVSIEIYAVGYLRDHLIGTVRFLVSNFLPTAAVKAPSLVAVQIRRPTSGEFYGVLNLAAMVIDASEIPADFFKTVAAEISRSRSSSASSSLSDRNAVRNLAGKNHARSSSHGGGLMCCLGVSRREMDG